MLIRSVELKDLDQIVGLNNQEAEWVGAKDRAFFERHLNIPFFSVVEEGDRVVAFLMAMDQTSDYDSRNFLWFRERLKKFHYVDRAIVAPERRRNGLGRALYNELIGEKGIPIVAEVSIDPPNTESVSFHEMFGFREVGTFSADGKKTCRMYQLH
jgi:predicted GNAT superfamily acetyltransferase